MSIPSTSPELASLFYVLSFSLVLSLFAGRRTHPHAHTRTHARTHMLAHLFPSLPSLLLCKIAKSCKFLVVLRLSLAFSAPKYKISFTFLSLVCATATTTTTSDVRRRSHAPPTRRFVRRERLNKMESEFLSPERGCGGEWRVHWNIKLHHFRPLLRAVALLPSLSPFLFLVPHKATCSNKKGVSSAWCAEPALPTTKCEILPPPDRHRLFRSNNPCRADNTKSAHAYELVFITYFSSIFSSPLSRLLTPEMTLVTHRGNNNWAPTHFSSTSAEAETHQTPSKLAKATKTNFPGDNRSEKNCRDVARSKKCKKRPKYIFKSWPK